MATYSAKRMYVPVRRIYLGEDKEEHSIFTYMSTIVNTVKFFSLESVFKDSFNPIVREYKPKKRTKKRAGGTETNEDGTGSTGDTRRVMLGIKNARAMGQKKIRITTWEKFPGENASGYFTVGFSIPKIITNLGVAQIMGALLKGKIASLPPEGDGVGKCSPDFTIDGSPAKMITELISESDRYLIGGDVLETDAEVETAIAEDPKLRTLSQTVESEQA